MIDGRLIIAMLYGTRAANIHKLQQVQNSMARAVTNSKRSEHNIKLVSASLHTQQVKYRVQYKLASTTF